MLAGPVLPAVLTEEEYLASEVFSEVRREYVGGTAYMMDWSDESHGRLAMVLAAMLGTQTRRRAPEAFAIQMRLRCPPVFAPGEPPWYYYPDAMIVCDPTDQGHPWRERPAALFEITSEATHRTDHGEKRLVYLQLPGLEFYVRIEHDRPEAAIDRFTPDGWKYERILGLESTIRLPSLEIELPMAELYERVVFGG